MSKEDSILPKTDIQPLDEYCESIINGEKEVCDFVYQAIARHYRDLERDGTEEFPYRFDKEECLNFISFFESNLNHYEGLFADDPIIFEPWQYFVYGSIFGWQRVEKMRGKKVRRFREAIIEIPKKQGKALDINTKIPTPDGWKLMKDLTVGDQVFDENGNPCNIVAETPIQKDRPCYKLIFSDGTSIVADENHEWSTSAHIFRENKLRKETPEESIRTTKEIYDTVLVERCKKESYNYTHRNHRINKNPCVKYMPVFKLKRKYSRQKPKPSKKTRNYYRQIVSVEKIESRPVKCIQVDSPNNMYLCGDGFIETHNSIISGGIALYGIGWDGVGGAQVYGLAKNRSHAEKLSYRAARIMVEKNEELKESFRINYSNTNLGVYNDENKSFFQPLTSKPESTDGLNVHMAINDETKDWGDFEIYNIIKDGTISMYNSLIVNITTAGPNKYSLGYDRRTYLTKILDGTLEDETTFGVIYTIDKGDQEHWDQEWVWEKAMPNYNVSVFGDKLKEKVPACRESQFEKNSFITKHLNVWTDAMDGFFNIDKWDECGGKLDMKDYVHLPCIITVDLSSKIDLTEVKVTFFKGEEYWTFCHFFLPEKRLENRQGDNENMKRQLKEWAADGYITLTPGETVDYDYVKETVLDLFKRCDVAKLAYDPWNATQFINDLQKEGIPADKMLEYGQAGYKNWSEPMKQTEKLIIEHKIHHDNNPVQKWCIGNVVGKTDVNNNIRPDKEFPQNKIDGAITLIMAVGTRMFGVDENEGLSPAAQRAMAKRKKEAVA